MDNTKITASKNGTGVPPTRKSRQAGFGTYNKADTAAILDKLEANVKADHARRGVGFLEATVITVDGQVRVEHDERNDALGRKLMDAWCWKRNESAKVLQIAVEVTDRRAGYKG